MKVLFFLSIFFSLNIYSQKTIEPGIYLSNDGLEYITILNDTDFGYTSFLNESPYLHDQKKIKQSFSSQFSKALMPDSTTSSSLFDNAASAIVGPWGETIE